MQSLYFFRLLFGLFVFGGGWVAASGGAVLFWGLALCPVPCLCRGSCIIAGVSAGVR